jgi:molybdopterin-containing oxidoreductase family iron-sulfur binding subunit
LFGDLNDPRSLVRKTKQEPHNYGLLTELNTQPRTSYLGRLRNPNPEIPATAPAAAAAAGATEKSEA